MNRDGQPDSPAELIDWLRMRLEIMEDNRQRDARRISELERTIEERDREIELTRMAKAAAIDVLALAKEGSL